MATTILRILKFGLQNFSRNGLLSATTTIILTMALLVFNSLLIFGVIANFAVTSLQDKIDISVYFKSGAPEDNILTLEKALESLSEVKSVDYVSQAKALEIFKEKHQEDAVIAQALNELQVNPLLGSLNVKAKDPSQYATIAEYLENANLSDIIEKVSYAQNKLAIERLASIVGIFRNTGLGITIFLALVAILVTFNTIRLAIYSNREEIGIMRLVGASNKFIRGPYIFAGVLYGVLAGIISLVISMPIMALAAPYVGAFIPELALSSYFFGHLPQLAFYQIAFGVFLGGISAGVAVRRYLKI